MTLLRMPGIYKILNITNNKCYIGSATWLGKRCNDHLNNLRKNKHPNELLQRAWNKYGEENFKIEVIEYCAVEILIEREQFWLDWTKCYVREFGYNFCNIAGRTVGVIKTPEQIAKHSVKITGRKRTQEEKDKISLGMLGKKNRLGTRQSIETRLKMGNTKRHREGTDIQLLTVLTLEDGTWQ